MRLPFRASSKTESLLRSTRRQSNVSKWMAVSCTQPTKALPETWAGLGPAESAAEDTRGTVRLKVNRSTVFGGRELIMRFSFRRVTPMRAPILAPSITPCGAATDEGRRWLLTHTARGRRAVRGFNYSIPPGYVTPGSRCNFLQLIQAVTGSDSARLRPDFKPVAPAVMIVVGCARRGTGASSILD